MARPTPDVNFGAGFDAAKFRAVIRDTMVMGLPNTVAEQATFRWTTKHTYNPQSPAHDPYAWTQAAVTTTSHADVIVPVAVEVSFRPQTGSHDTDIGEFDILYAKLTILDVDYALIAGADVVLLGGNAYEIEFVEPPQGLFEVTVYFVHCRSRDEA